MSLAFDILSEADIRLPNAMGSAISIVGALILGEAAIQAGIASPITVIIVAITSVSALCLPSKEFTNAVKLWRLLFMFFFFKSLSHLVIMGPN
jgi:spore germination protein KA